MAKPSKWHEKIPLPPVILGAILITFIACLFQSLVLLVLGLFVVALVWAAVGLLIYERVRTLDKDDAATESSPNL